MFYQKIIQAVTGLIGCVGCVQLRGLGRHDSEMRVVSLHSGEYIGISDVDGGAYIRLVGDLRVQPTNGLGAGCADWYELQQDMRVVIFDPAGLPPTELADNFIIDLNTCAVPDPDDARELSFSVTGVMIDYERIFEEETGQVPDRLEGSLVAINLRFGLTITNCKPSKKTCYV